MYACERLRSVTVPLIIDPSRSVSVSVFFLESGLIKWKVKVKVKRGYSSIQITPTFRSRTNWNQARFFFPGAFLQREGLKRLGRGGIVDVRATLAPRRSLRAVCVTVWGESKSQGRQRIKLFSFLILFKNQIFDKHSSSKASVKENRRQVPNVCSLCICFDVRISTATM